MDHSAWLRNCFKSMTNRVGDLCDISSGTTRLFPTVSADDLLDDDISDAGNLPNDDHQEDEEDDEVEEIEEPVALVVESVAHRLVCCF